MDKKDHFEKKVKESLENFSPAYEDAAWGEFAPLLDAAQLPFWKRWYAPYLFSTLLFLIATTMVYVGMYSRNTLTQDSSPAITEQSDVPVTSLRDTVYIYDTIYVYRTTTAIGVTDSVSSQLSPAIAADAVASGQQVPGKQVNPSTSDNKPLTPPGTDDARRTGPTGGKTQLIPGKSPVSLPSDLASLPDKKSRETTQARSMAAPAVGKKNNPVDRLDFELVIGDTSNLSAPPLRPKAEKSIFVSSAVSMMLPISRTVEFNPALYPSLGMGIKWNRKTSLSVGIILGNNTGEIDDPEELNPDILSGFPGVTDLPDAPDDIMVSNRQLYFPLTLIFQNTSLDRIGFEGNVGVLGNYLMHQKVRYLFEEETGIPDQNFTVTSNEFTISHLQLGIGTSYSISDRLSIHLRTNYWLPIQRMGLVKERIHGLDVNLGMNYSLWKRP